MKSQKTPSRQLTALQQAAKQNPDQVRRLLKLEALRRGLPKKR